MTARQEPVFSRHKTDEILMALIEDFGTQLADTTDQAAKALEAGDLPALAQLCHKARGSAATFGFDELAQRYQTLEIASEQVTPTAELQMFFKVIRLLESRVQAGIALSKSETAE